jgi:hypothetical protein
MEAKKRAKLLKRKPQGSPVTYKELQERIISSRSPGHIHSIHVGTSRSATSADTSLQQARSPDTQVYCFSQNQVVRGQVDASDSQEV